MIFKKDGVNGIEDMMVKQVKDKIKQNRDVDDAVMEGECNGIVKIIKIEMAIIKMPVELDGIALKMVQ